MKNDKKYSKRSKRASCLDLGGGNLLTSDNNGFRVLKSGKWKVESGKLVPKAIRHEGNRAISFNPLPLGEDVLIFNFPLFLLIALWPF